MRAEHLLLQVDPHGRELQRRFPEKARERHEGEDQEDQRIGGEQVGRIPQRRLRQLPAKDQREQESAHDDDPRGPLRARVQRPVDERAQTAVFLEGTQQKPTKVFEKHRKTLVGFWLPAGAHSVARATTTDVGDRPLLSEI